MVTVGRHATRLSGRCAPRPPRRAPPPRALALSPADVKDALPEGFVAGLIVLGARTVACGSGAAALEARIESTEKELDARKINYQDLIVQPGEESPDRWYLVGDWKPPKVGDRKRGNSYYLGQLRLRLRLDDAEKKCKELKIKTDDVDAIISASQVKAQNPVQSRVNELAARIKAKEAELGVDQGGWFGSS